MCYGGVDGSMERKTCEAGSCGKDVRVNIKPSSKANQPIPGPNSNKESVDEAAGSNTPRLFESNDVKSSGDSKNQHTTLLIIGVGFGSLIVGGVVMLFAVRMRRHRTLRKSAAGSYRGRKNLLSVSFSTNTEPSIERFSPTTQTTVDANADFEL
uniref:Uncharacterized protein n=1 Tax=Ciona savignyi TaxID=51511 RepID=H2YNI5_CIOSA